jgi:hypothetical protein
MRAQSKTAVRTCNRYLNRVDNRPHCCREVSDDNAFHHATARLMLNVCPQQTKFFHLYRFAAIGGRQVVGYKLPFSQRWEKGPGDEGYNRPGAEGYNSPETRALQVQSPHILHRLAFLRSGEKHCKLQLHRVQVLTIQYHQPPGDRGCAVTTPPD